jgi:hypothetical protein
VTLEPRVFHSVALPLNPAQSQELGRADILIGGLEQAGPSFELRVYVDNPSATADTAATPEEGYAGSVYVYGYGAPGPGLAAPSTGPRLPMTRYVVATDALRAAAARGEALSITLVPVAFGGPEPDVDLGAAEVSIIIRE